MLPASALPVIVGVLSFVVVEEVVRDGEDPFVVVFIVIANTEEEVEVLPAASVAVAVNE